MIRLLVVEDEPLIAQMLISWAQDISFAIVGPASSNRDAMRLIDESSPLDVAILDICISDGDSYMTAERLKAANIPFVFATGLSGESINPAFADAPVATKPFDFDDLHAMLLALVPSCVATGSLKQNGNVSTCTE